MMYTPPPHPREGELLAENRIQEKARKRDLHLYPDDISNPQKRLSRNTYVLIQLVVILLIIVLMLTLYHFLH